MSINIEQITESAYAGNVSTRQLVMHFAGVENISELTTTNLADVNTNFQEYWAKKGLWPNKREIGTANTDSPSGWQALANYASTILDREPTNARAYQLKRNAVVYQLITVMKNQDLSNLKKAAKKAEKVAEVKEEVKGTKTIGITPGDCPITTVWDTLEYNGDNFVSPYVITFPLPLVREKVVTSNDLLTILSEVSERSTKSELLAIISKVREMIA